MPPPRPPADTAAVNRIFSSEQFRDLMRRFVHAEFVKDEDGQTFEDRGFNLIDQMPINIAAAAQDVELDIPAYRATWERVADMMDDEKRQADDELEMLELNIKAHMARIEVALRTDDPSAKQEFMIPASFNATDKSIAAFVLQHPSVAAMQMERAKLKANLREKLVDLDFARHAVKALEMYHVSLQKHIDKRVYGMRYEVMPTHNPAPPQGATPAYPQQREQPKPMSQQKAQPKKNDEPRTGMREF